MAIIFVSTRKKQKMFLWGIFGLLVFAVAVISFLVIFPEFKKSSDVVVQDGYNAPDVKVNFTVVDSAQVQNLESFPAGSLENGTIAGRANPFKP